MTPGNGEHCIIDGRAMRAGACGARADDREDAKARRREVENWNGLNNGLAAGAVIVLILAVAGHALPPWVHMWALAFAVYGVCKAVTWQPAARDGRFENAWMSLGYLLLWPGMDVRPFLKDAPDTNTGLRHSRAGGNPDNSRTEFAGSLDSRLRGNDKEWIEPVAKFACGFALIALAFPTIAPKHPMLAGWLGMIGLLCVLHFGGFHALALWWRARGVAVEPIMQRPMLARNLGEFWSRRWNRAFADLAARFVLRPIARRWSPAAGLFASFVASGVIHDLVISVPARGGYGLPTIYFTINGLTVLMLRGKHARRLRLNTGWRGRTIAMAVLALPLPLVVHEPFVMNVIVPFIDAVTTFDMKGALP